MQNGKQLLLQLLTSYSQTFQEKDEVEETTDKVKAGLLLHGSTPPFMYEMVERCAWLTQDNVVDEENRGPAKQGLGLKQSQLLLSDLFAALTQDENNIPECLKESYPEVSVEEYKTGIHLVWLLLKLFEWRAGDPAPSTSEQNWNEAEKLIEAYRRILATYRANPSDFFS